MCFLLENTSVPLSSSARQYGTEATQFRQSASNATVNLQNPAPTELPRSSSAGVRLRTPSPLLEFRMLLARKSGGFGSSSCSLCLQASKLLSISSPRNYQPSSAVAGQHSSNQIQYTAGGSH